MGDASLILGRRWDFGATAPKVSPVCTVIELIFWIAHANLVTYPQRSVGTTGDCVRCRSIDHPFKGEQETTKFTADQKMFRPTTVSSRNSVAQIFSGTPLRVMLYSISFANYLVFVKMAMSFVLCLLSNLDLH